MSQPETSFAGGKVTKPHSSKMTHSLTGVGFDGTANLGVLTLRASFDGGKRDADYYLSGFSYSEYALNNNLDINLGVKAEKILHHAVDGTLYAGCTIKNKFFTTRGAYSYGIDKNDHRISLQVYMLFSTAF